MTPGEVSVVAPDALLPLAEALADEARRPRPWLGLDTVDVTPLTIVLVEDADDFAQWAQGRVPRWGAGLAVPGRRLVVIRRNAADPFKTLRHELAHIALHSRIRGRVPLWFSEGYAALAAGEHGRLDALQLNLAVALNRIPTLHGVDAALRGSTADAGVAYALAADAVAEVARRHPTRSLAPLLSRLRAGEGFDAALLASTGLDFDGFDERWHRAVRGRYNLGIWALTGGAWLLLAGLLAFLAALRRRRDAPRRAALDEGWIVEADEEYPPARQNDGTMTTALGDPHTLDPPPSGR
jgi:hypothetical protein